MEDEDNRLTKNLLDFKKEKQEFEDQSRKVVNDINDLKAKDAENKKQLDE